MSSPLADETARCRLAQADWSRRPVRERLRPVRELRHLLAGRADELTAAVAADLGRPPDEVVATDLLPTAAACKFLGQKAERILRPRRVGWRPLWLMGCRDTVHRRPHGVVGVIGTWNYPVFLNVVPVVQAVAAGNGVVWKPSELAPRTAEVLHGLLLAAGFPADLVVKLPATREAGPLLTEADIDFLHFTGSEAVGRKLAARLGERLIPSVLELSGCDALFVLADADVGLAARAAWYGATLNGGQTCMATRRAFVDRAVYGPFREAVRGLAGGGGAVRLMGAGQVEQMRRLVAEAADAGCEVVGRDEPGRSPTDVTPTVIVDAKPGLAICREASFAPLLAVLPVDSLDDAVRLHGESPFALTAAVFTADPAKAATLATQLPVGAVVVNDVIAPTAHPAIPFGGRRASGWGVTQGADGLLQMTVPQVVTVRNGSFRPHVDATLTGDPAAGHVTRGLLRLTHGRGLRERFAGLRQMIGGMRRTANGRREPAGPG